MYVVKGLKTPLLGRSIIDSLKLVTRLDSIESFGNSIVKKFSMLFTGLGEMECEIKLKPDAQPFALHTPRRIPIPFFSKVKTELD